MATWDEFKAYIKAEYTVERETNDGNGLTMVFPIDDKRSQMAFIWLHHIGDDAWVEIESPVGEVDKNDALTVLRSVAELICGGLSITEDVYTLKHSMPIANVDANEFEDPLAAVVIAADRIENELTGKDKW